VRRLTGIAGEAAQQAIADAEVLDERIEAIRREKPETLEQDIAALTEAINTGVLPVLDRTRLRDKLAELQKVVKEHQKAKAKEAEGDVVDAARQLADGADGDVIVASIDGADGNSLRKAMDVIRGKKPDAAMMLAAADDEKVAFLASVPQAMIDKGLKAGDWVREVAKVAGGGGGGRPDMAQAGGKNPAMLNDALERARIFAAEQLG